MKSGPHRKDKDKDYLCHEDHGHLIRERMQLKDEIKALIKNNFLKEYVGKKERIMINQQRTEADKGK